VGKIEDAVRKYYTEIESKLGGSIRLVLSPHSTEIDETALGELPTVVLQGPEVRTAMRDYTIDSVKTGETGGGIDIRDVRKSRTIVDLVFRMRLFTDTLLSALAWVERLNEIGQSLYKIEIVETDDTIIFSGNDPVTVEIADHEMRDEDILTVSNTTDAASLPNGDYGITVVDKDNVTVDFSGSGNSGTCSISYVKDEYGIEYGFDFSSDTVPNFSDMKHFEIEAVIEGVEIDGDVAETGYAAASPLQVESERL